jgi:hypothetical protein
LDITRGEWVEAELDVFIERRHERRVKSEGERAEEELWMESERKYWERRRRQLNAARYAHEMNMCELHERLAAEREARALKLLEDDE